MIKPCKKCLHIGVGTVNRADGCYVVCLNCKHEVGPSLMGESGAIDMWQEDNDKGDKKCQKY